MAGKHTGPRTWSQDEEEWIAHHLATHGVVAQLPLRGRHQKTCAPAIVKAHYNRWLNSAERAYARKEDTWSGLRSTTPSRSTPRS